MARLSLWLLLWAPLCAWAQLSPGPLSQPHAHLGGEDGCVNCHPKLRKQTNERCLECHPLIEARLEARRGYHGRHAQAQRCAECHKEHRGRAAALIRWPGGGEARFRHALTGYTLEGRHAELECAECHNRARVAEEEAFKLQRTRLGLSPKCRVCHAPENPHADQFSPRPCDECHDQQEWKPPARFDHGRRFPLRGQHLDVSCEGCHPEGRFAGTPDGCVDCHEPGHPPQAGFGDDCAACHTESAWSQIIFDRSKHPAAFPLRHAHGALACAACHGGALPRDQGCAGCHESPHSRRFPKDCARCHTDEAFRPARRGRFHHDLTAFPLEGRHRRVECAECHHEGQLRPIAHATCADCHADPHGVNFARPCEACHQPHGFRPSTFPLDAHPQWILDGAHRAVGCPACHQTGEALDFRWGAACADCHEDEHEGQFGARRCDDCHDLDAWGVARASVQHPEWVERGAHAEAACAHCHAEGRYASTPDDCVACHGSPHLGQFMATEPRRGCDACHEVAAAAWEMPEGWPHAHWPLEGAHAEAKCEACHREVRLGDGRLTTRWRLGFQACGRCHENVHQR